MKKLDIERPEILVRDYRVGNTNHEIYEFPDANKREAWTLVIGEDQPNFYRPILSELVKRNIVGRAVTVDLSDENGLVDLLANGRATLGDPDCRATVEGVDRHLTIVVLDIKDDTKGRADLYRGIDLADRLRSLVEGRMLHLTAYEESHLANEARVDQRHRQTPLLCAMKGPSGELKQDAFEQLSKFVENMKRSYGGNSFFVDRGDSFKIIYKTPTGQTKATTFQPVTPGALMVHWLLAEKALPLEHLAMYCGLKDSGGTKTKRRAQPQIHQDYDHWLTQRKTPSLDATSGDAAQPKRSYTTSSPRKTALLKKIEDERVTSEEEMMNASFDLATKLAFNLFGLTMETTDDATSLKQNAELLLARMSTDTEIKEYLSGRNVSIKTKATHLKRALGVNDLWTRHLLKLENHCYVEMLKTLLERFLEFVGNSTEAEKAFDIYGEPLTHSDEGFLWVCPGLKERFDERKAEFDSHHNSWTAANAALQPPWQQAQAESPETKHPLKENLQALRKHFISDLKEIGLEDLAVHFQGALTIHHEKMFYGTSEVKGIPWKRSPISGPIIPTSIKNFTDLPFYKLWEADTAARATV